MYADKDAIFMKSFIITLLKYIKIFCLKQKLKKDILLRISVNQQNIIITFKSILINNDINNYFSNSTF
jgi:hypothetical protein